ncbi:PREDICTED: protein virilizer homolog [Nanorana parkeri]|uniref:protein virilizer homolog n=1 Tax=Nanorana parkeri TaxID=125878 RepID=UPI000854F102|nr:PREDICTED: protein virilizer homolog [Nanorana parkeri]
MDTMDKKIEVLLKRAWDSSSMNLRPALATTCVARNMEFWLSQFRTHLLAGEGGQGLRGSQSASVESAGVTKSGGFGHGSHDRLPGGGKMGSVPPETSATVLPEELESLARGIGRCLFPPPLSKEKPVVVENSSTTSGGSEVEFLGLRTLDHRCQCVGMGSSYNITAVVYLNKQGGTRSWPLQLLAKEIFSWAEVNLKSLFAVHLRGTHNILADYLSRHRILQDEWVLNQEEQSKEDDSLESLLDNVAGFRLILETVKEPLPLSDQDLEPVLTTSDALQNLFNNRTVYVLADVMDEQLKSLSFSPFQPDEADVDLDMMKVDLIDLSAKCCCDFDLKAELEKSFLLEPSSPGRTKATKGFKLGKHKHETFITSGRSEYIEPAKRAHFVPLPRGRGRGGFGQGMRPHDLFRQRKQNTSRPPSMHVDDFVAAERKEVPPAGIQPPKRPPKATQKVSSRGGFLGNRGGRGAFHSQSRFFTPPAPKVNYSRREGVRVINWPTQTPPRATYVESRGAQSNFDRGPLPPLRQSSAGYRPNPRERAARGRGGLGPSWTNAAGSGNASRGKFLGGNGSRGRHVRSFTR